MTGKKTILPATLDSLDLAILAILQKDNKTPKELRLSRFAAIARFGADMIRVSGIYDDSAAEASKVAEENGWTVLSDTSWPGYLFSWSSASSCLICRRFRFMGDIESRNPDGPGRMIASLLSLLALPGRGAPRKWPRNSL